MPHIKIMKICQNHWLHSKPCLSSSKHSLFATRFWIRILVFSCRALLWIVTQLPLWFSTAADRKIVNVGISFILRLFPRRQRFRTRTRDNLLCYHCATFIFGRPLAIVADPTWFFSDPDPTIQIIIDQDPVSDPAWIFSNIFYIKFTFVSLSCVRVSTTTTRLNLL
jgi:hypothetical protein